MAIDEWLVEMRCRQSFLASNHRPRQNAQRLEIPFSMPEMNRRCRKK